MSGFFLAKNWTIARRNSSVAAGRRSALLGLSCLAPFWESRKTMAWTCHGCSNDDMIDKLVQSRIILSGAVENAMRKVDRGIFSPFSDSAYEDSPQAIGHGATISAPHMHAHCLELLIDHLKPGCVALDVGSGTGYLTAVMAYMVSLEDTRGRAVGVEHIAELVSNSLTQVKEISWAKDMVEDGRLILVQGDGREGFPSGAPFDCIHVGAAAPNIPRALTEQLKPGGRLLLPVGPEGGLQSLTIVDKLPDGKLKISEAFGVTYVPLTDASHQLDRRFW